MIQWKIENLERDPKTGLVKKVHYSTSIEDGIYKSFGVGQVELEGGANQPNFIPFEDLSKEQVVEWVKQKLGENYIQEMSYRLETDLNEKKNPKVLMGVPWPEYEGQVK